MSVTGQSHISWILVCHHRMVGCTCNLWPIFLVSNHCLKSHQAHSLRPMLNGSYKPRC